VSKNARLSTGIGEAGGRAELSCENLTNVAGAADYPSGKIPAATAWRKKRSDPFETGIDAMAYKTWMFERLFVLVPAQDYVAKFLATFREFPPRQKPGSFNIDAVMNQLTAKPSGD
jgi:hypothetical protein